MVGATTVALQRYGPEILGFLVAIHKDHDEAAEAFSLFSEHLWQGIADFEWKCSLRTWAYTLARNASLDARRRETRHARHRAPISEASIAKVAAQVRTSTLSALRTERRTALQRLREELSEEDRALLILRVDRQLAWRDLALVLAGSEQAREEAQISRDSARLRKQFQAVKDKLRALGKARGLL